MNENIFRLDIKDILSEKYKELLSSKDDEIIKLKKLLKEKDTQIINLSSKVENFKNTEEKLKELSLSINKEKDIKYLVIWRFTLEDYPTDYDKYTITVKYQIVNSMEEAIKKENEVREEYIKKRKTPQENNRNTIERHDINTPFKIESVIIPYIPSKMIGDCDLDKYIKEYMCE